jgi:iron complex transport system substrate-binding protein
VTRADLQMLLVLVGALGLSALTLLATRERGATGDAPRDAEQRHSLVDANGTRVALRPFARVGSSSILADRLLLELAEPERIVGLSGHGFDSSSIRHRYGARARIDPSGDLEALIELRPDLLLVNNYADRKRIERLREVGVVVFELGPMRGLASLLAQIESTALLLGAPERGAELARSLTSAMRAVAADIAPAQRKRGLYVGAHGKQLYGGTRGTSYHDALTHAGLIDAAAERYRDWPEYTSEELLALDPEVVITPTGQRGVLCRNPALSQLRACGSAGRVVEIDAQRLVDPGLTMLEVTQRIRDAVYGSIDAPAPAPAPAPAR